jgi:hypothetical protein
MPMHVVPRELEDQKLQLLAASQSPMMANVKLDLAVLGLALIASGAESWTWQSHGVDPFLLTDNEYL